ncbi:hypothetical protein GPZ77_34730 (plasmid) [Streptomyces sp. QHH-9511]|uniref:DUF6221 family protein n=1 Tax=Streptomyces sp. QHH-9511 TaxID=2684468 RepID=UPI001318867C|nr:DUF6221 family protein [Streptomyces sp. QHH-9511]QGZ53384.1 hypothetical protein GPZ77_34730 [Streptomyces sp. QHH-9511]
MELDRTGGEVPAEDTFGRDAGLMVFLNDRFAERRATAHGLPLAEAQIAVAEVDAVQSILDEVLPKAYDRRYGSGFDDAAEVAWDVARRLAVPYDTHPDYREEWRP